MKFKVGDAIKYKGYTEIDSVWSAPLYITEIRLKGNGHKADIYIANRPGKMSGGFTEDMIEYYIPELNDQKLKKALGIK